VCHPRCVILYITIKQYFSIQHFVMVIHKATCYGCKRQPSPGFKIQEYMKMKSYIIPFLYIINIILILIYICLCIIYKKEIIHISEA